MFGYLNLNDPTKIENNESQEAVNLRLDKGYLEYSSWTVQQDTNRLTKDTNGKELFIDSTFPNPGAIKRKNSSSVFVKLGMYNEEFASAAWNPGDSVGDSPEFTPAASTDNKSYYALTIYDPDENEESWPYFWEHENGVAFEMKNLPGIKTLHPTRVNAEWRLYRRPLGGSQYLRVYITPAPAYDDLATNRVDGKSDSELGEPLGTVDTYPPNMFGYSEQFSNIIVHNSRLWFVRYNTTKTTGKFDTEAGYALYFSKPYIPGEVPVLNYFLFESRITNIFSFNEQLLVLTVEGIFVIYGDSATDFVVKEIGSSKIGAAGLYSAESLGSAVMFVSSLKTNRIKLSSIFMIENNQLRKISDNITSVIPTSFTAVPYGTNTVEDRFILIKLSGITFVYDAAVGGFVLGGVGTSNFSYKSKEFGRPGWWENARRMFVRATGTFFVTIWIDGVFVDTISFDIAGTQPVTEDFTIPPYRGNYFAYSFDCQPNAKIYEFGRKE